MIRIIQVALEACPGLKVLKISTTEGYPLTK